MGSLQLQNITNIYIHRNSEYLRWGNRGSIEKYKGTTCKDNRMEGNMKNNSKYQWDAESNGVWNITVMEWAEYIAFIAKENKSLWSNV